MLISKKKNDVMMERKSIRMEVDTKVTVQQKKSLSGWKLIIPYLNFVPLKNHGVNILHIF